MKPPPYTPLEIEHLASAVDGLHRSLVVKRQRGRECDHLALTRPDLPCPHPDCYVLPPGLPVLRIIKRPDPITFALGSEMRIDEPSLEEEAFYRERMVVQHLAAEDQIFWAWRPVSPPKKPGEAMQ